MTTPNPIEAGEERVAEIARMIEANIKMKWLGHDNAVLVGFAEAARAIASLPDKRDAALRLALPLLERDYRSLLECCSSIDDELEPIPGTLDDDAKDDAAAYDTAIKAIRDALGEDE